MFIVFDKLRFWYSGNIKVAPDFPEQELLVLQLIEIHVFFVIFVTVRGSPAYVLAMLVQRGGDV
jgi:hypothetical protein